MKYPGPLSADEVEALRSRLDQTAPCAQPGCRETIRFQTGVRGRRQRFCSGRCRAKFSRERSRLHVLWARLTYDAEEHRSEVPAKELEHLADQVIWLLEPYGGVDKRLAYELVQVPTRPEVPIEAALGYLDVVTDEDLESLQRFVHRVTAYRQGEAVTVNRHDPLAE